MGAHLTEHALTTLPPVGHNIPDRISTGNMSHCIALPGNCHKQYSRSHPLYLKAWGAQACAYVYIYSAYI